MSQIYSNIQGRWIPCLFINLYSLLPFQPISTWAASWSAAVSPSRIQFPNQHLHLHRWLYKPGLWTMIRGQWKFPFSDASSAAQSWWRCSPAYWTADRAHTGSTKYLSNWRKLVCWTWAGWWDSVYIPPANSMLPAECLRVWSFHQKLNWFVKETPDIICTHSVV